MDPIQITMNPDGSFDLPAVHVAPYVAPVDPTPEQPPATAPTGTPPADPAPSGQPAPPTLVGMTLTADKDVTALNIGDVFAVVGTLNYSDGSTKAVAANAFGGFDKTIVTNPNSWTGTFTAKGPGTTTITDSNAGVAGKLKVTVLAPVPPPDGAQPPEPEPPLPPNDPVPPPAPVPEDGGATHVAALTVADGANRQWFAQATVGNDATAPGIYVRFASAEGVEHPRLTAKFYADGVDVGVVRADAAHDELNCKIVGTYDGQPIAFPAPTYADGTVHFWRGCVFTGRYGKQVDFDAAKIDHSLIPQYAGDAGSFDDNHKDYSFNGMGCASMPGMGSAGERADIGPYSQWDTAFLTSPNATTWGVVRRASDHDGVWPVFFCDPETGGILDVDKYPNANLLPKAQQSSFKATNPIVEYAGSMNGDTLTPPPNGWRISKCPNVPNGAHLTSYALVAAMVTGTARDRDHASFWGNFPLLEIGPNYRQSGGVMLGAQRRSAWCLRNLFVAGYVSSDCDYFQRHTARQLEVANSKIARNDMGLVLTSTEYIGKGAVAGYKGLSLWMQGYHAMILGLVAAKLSAWQDFAQYVTGFYTKLLATKYAPLITIYNWYCIDASGQYIPTLEGQVRATLAGANNGEQFSADQVERIIAAPDIAGVYAVMKEATPTWQGQCVNGVCDFNGAITSPDSYPANAIAAAASAKTVGTPGADAAWAYCQNLPTKPVYGACQKYHIVPEAA